MGTEENVLWQSSSMGARYAADVEISSPALHENLCFFFPLHFPLHSGDTNTSVGCIVSWWKNYLLEKTNTTRDFFIWSCFLTWFTKQLYKRLCHCKGGKGWGTDMWWGRSCCFSHWCWIMLAYCVCLLLCAQSNPPQTRTDSVFQKNLTSFSKNSTFKLYFVTQNSQLRLPRNLKTTSKLYCNRSNIIICWV